MAWRLSVKALLLLGFGVSAATAADMPGTHFEVSPGSLPAPYATPAVENSSKVVPRPAGARPEAPAGFTVTAYATGLSNPRWLAVAPNGDVFLAEPDASKITLLRGTDKATSSKTFASSFDKPHGIAFHDGALYVSDIKAVWRIEDKDGVAGARTRVTKQADLGIGGHFTRDLAFGPDGALYIGIGSNENIDDQEPAFRAAVDKVNPDGTLSQFATGIRNPVGLAFYPGTNDLWVSVNERDGMGDGLVPDYLTHVQPGAFYGWPYAYTGPHADPVFGKKRPDMVAKTTAPDLHVPVAFRADRPGVLRRRSVPRRVQRRRVRLAARLMEQFQAHRLQSGARAFCGRQAGRRLRQFPHRIPRRRHQPRTGVGPARGTSDRQRRQPAGRRRCGQNGVARHLFGEVATPVLSQSFTRRRNSPQP